MENALRHYLGKLTTTPLSETQELVSSNLAPIFTFYTKKQLDAVVLHQTDSYIPPVDMQGLLQRCIDFILDHPDLIEEATSASVTQPADVIDVFSDDDDFEMIGAANTVEARLSSNTSNINKQLSESSKPNHGLYTYCVDDLPVISPPRKRNTENSPRKWNIKNNDCAEIIITTSPDIVPRKNLQLYSGVSSADELPPLNVPRSRTQNTSAKSPAFEDVDELPDISIPQLRNTESADILVVKQNVLADQSDTHSVHSEQLQYVNSKNLSSVVTSRSEETKTFPSIQSAGETKTSSKLTADVLSTSQHKSENVSGNISLFKERGTYPIRKDASDCSPSVSSSQIMKDRLPYAGTSFGNSLGNGWYPDYMQYAGYQNLSQMPAPYPGYPKPWQTPSAYPAHHSVIRGQMSSVMSSQSNVSVPGSYTLPKTFRELVDDQVGFGQGNSVPGYGHGSSLHQVPVINIPSTCSNVQYSLPHRDKVASDGRTLDTTGQGVKSSDVSQNQYIHPDSEQPTVHPVVPPPPSHTLEPQPPMSFEQQLEEWKIEVLQLFPKVDLQHLDGRLRAHYGPMAVNNVCSELLETPDYPKSHTEDTDNKQPPKEDPVDYYKDYAKVELSEIQKEESLRLLQAEFRRVSLRDIREVLSTCKGHYAPAYKVLAEAMKEAYTKREQNASASSSKTSPAVTEITIKTQNGGEGKKIVAKLLKGSRSVKSMTSCSEILQQEVDFVKKKMAEQKEKEDYEIAWKLNEAQYEEDGQTIECGCCYCEHPFENMVQCTEGHLFCSQCLLSYAKEAVFGSGKLNLICMTTGCGATYPYSELTRALPSEILCQYEERLREENLNLADLTNLVRCPHCNYAAIMEVEGDKVFRCQNKDCMRETCRLCKEDWTEHIGLPCEKVEKKDETRLRKEYEEKMTEAKVRTCHRCKSKFMKEEGCNKMTCTCRATMCYICRAPNIDYNHFCRHPRDPGKSCTLCKACSLWTNPDEDDKRAIEEIQREAQEKRKEIGFIDDKVIGAPTDPPAAKKARKK